MNELNSQKNSNYTFNMWVIAIYFVILAFILSTVLDFDNLISFPFFFIFLVPLFYILNWKLNSYVIYLMFCFISIGKIIHFYFLETLANLDGIRYYEQFLSFSSLSDFLAYFYEHVTTFWLSSSSYPIFGIIYMPYFYMVKGIDPIIIVTLNTLFLTLTIYLISKLNFDFFNYGLSQKHLFVSILVLCLALSPNLMYFSSIFGKDVASLFFGVVTVYMLLNRRYILFIPFLLYAIALRPYSIVFVICYYLVFKRSKKVSLIVCILSLIVLGLYVGFDGIINSFLLTAFLFVSPNPFKLENWDSLYFLQSIEAIVMIFTILLSIICFITIKETRKFYFICLSVLVTYSCALVLVGYTYLEVRSIDYSVGSIGDDMVRKKVPIMPLLYMIMIYSIFNFRKLTRSLGLNRDYKYMKRRE